MKTILIITHSLDMGGVQKSLISLLNSIDYTKYKVDLLSSSDGNLKKDINVNVNIIERPQYFDWYLLPKEKILTRSLPALPDIESLFYSLYYISWGLVKKNMGQARQLFFEKIHHKIPVFNTKYDIAIDYNGNYKNLISRKVNAETKVCWVHSDYRVYKTMKYLDEKYFSYMSKIVTISETASDILVEEFPQFESKIDVMQNISDKILITEMANSFIPEVYTSEVVNIVGVTRIDSNKGLELAIEACKILIDNGYKINWYIVGGGKQEDSIRKKIIELGMDNNFFLLGEQENPYPFILNADIFAHCSYFEGKSVAIDEAKLLGTPVIVTNYPTAKDQITTAIEGLIVELSPDKIAEGIIELITNDILYKQIRLTLSEFDLPVSESVRKFEEIIG